MRISRFLNIAVLATLATMSGAVLANAQDEKPQDPKPRQEESKPEPKQDEMKAPKPDKQEQMKPAQEDKQNQMKPAQQGDMKPQQPEEAKPSKEQQKAQKDQQKQQEKEQKDQMKHNEKEPAAQTGTEARPAAQGNDRAAVGHPKGKSARIPDPQFKQSFGRSHTFVVQRTTVVQGQPGFVSGGVNFIFLDPWPMDWAYTDDCYVDYVDGEYFLFDLLHPGIRIALFVVL